MIDKINTIQNLGIYKSYKADSTLQNFNRYNLFYGWNGSGKTTISKLFRMIETKKIPDEYNTVKFNIEINSQKYNEKNLQNINENIFVFNEEFVNENINWDEKINKILLLSADKVEDSKEYNSLKEEINGNEETNTIGLRTIYEEENDKLNRELKEIEDLYSKIAKNVKNIFQTIDPSDKEYNTLNRTKIQNIFDTTEELDEILKYNIEKTEVDNLILSLNTEKKEIIKYKKMNIDKNKFINLFSKIKESLLKIVTAKVIERLKQNSDISTWVNQGLKLKKKYKNEVCEFCGNIISSERINELENHFNDEVDKIKNELETLSIELSHYNIKSNEVIIDQSLFYKENFSKVKELNKDITEELLNLNGIINIIIQKIEEKIKNPFAQIELNEIEKIEAILNKYNEYLICQEKYVQETNNKTINFEKQIKEKKSKLEKYYLKNEFETENIVNKRKKYTSDKNKVESIREKLNKKEIRINELESSLSNETLGAEKFNEKLDAFIGYDELSLRFDKVLKGYEILRKSTKEKALHLSEGEKTAIAFVYFLTKVKENGNKIEDSIIVIDDPISSFDNNKLFSAYSSIRSEFDKCKQLFISTHNFNFFKLIRDWIKKKKSDDDNKEKYYSIYKIEPTIDNGIRVGNIKNAGKSLNQTSEYDYVFECVYKLKDKELNETDIFNCGNACRKLLESFLSFKFPKQRGNIQALLDKAFDQENEMQDKNRVYKFINAYSHLDVIESTEISDIDTLLAESKGIVKIILDKIEYWDGEHYRAMVHIANSTSEI